MDDKPRRKSRTSTAVKRRYNAANYDRVAADLDKDLVAEFRRVTTERGISIASVLRDAIERFLQEDKKKRLLYK